MDDFINEELSLDTILGMMDESETGVEFISSTAHVINTNLAKQLARCAYQAGERDGYERAYNIYK